MPVAVHDVPFNDERAASSLNSVSPDPFFSWSLPPTPENDLTFGNCAKIVVSCVVEATSGHAASVVGPSSMVSFVPDASYVPPNWLQPVEPDSDLPSASNVNVG